MNTAAPQAHLAPSAGKLACKAVPTPRAGITGELRASWIELAENASEPNPFFEHWFLEPSLKLFGQEHDPVLLAVYEDTRLIGLMPLAHRSPQHVFRRAFG